MRRAIAVAVVSGLISGGIAAAPAWARPAGTAPEAATKTIVYAGYELRVPASWPVYRLAADPSTCIRYDVHAVYLGIPGANENCPAGLAGRTQTVSIIPSTVVAAGAGAEVTDQRAQPFQAGATRVAGLPAVGGTVMANAEQHELRVALGAAGSGATVIATYGASPAPAEQVLATLRRAPGTVHIAAQPASPSESPPSPSPFPSLSPSPPPAPSLPPSPSPPPAPGSPVAAFDACTAPSLATMRVWRSAYAAAGVYIGGVNAACAYGNLSASWIRSAQAMGWGLIPTYVGPQAPCTNFTVTIDPKQAAAEGSAAGADAVNDAGLLGLGAGTPIYYDMEAYDSRAKGCTAAVLTFLGAWDRAVTARGDVPGVYSSQDSGIDDMEAAAVANTPGFTAPTAIWIALWDNQATLADGTLVWPVTDRNKQYQGSHNRTVGHITLNIDSDLAGGPLAQG